MKNHRDYIQDCLENNKVDELISHMDKYVKSNSSMIEFERISFYNYFLFELKIELKNFKSLEELNKMPFFRVWQEYGFTNYIERDAKFN